MLNNDDLSKSEVLIEDVRRHNNFGVLRLLLASLVVVSHSPEIIDGNKHREIVYKLSGIMSLGQISVDGFFIISGYLILKSFSESGSWRIYLRKRILRIYPGFIVASIICVFIFAPLAGGHIAQISFVQFVVKLVLILPPNLTGAFQKLPIPELNRSVWTIAYEFRCYLLIILVGNFAIYTRRIYFTLMLGFICILYMICQSLPNIPYKGTVIFGETADMIRLALPFFVGSAFYIWRNYIEYTFVGAFISVIVCISSMFMGSWAESFLLPAGAYLVFWYAFAAPISPLSRLTDSIDPSYGLYLYAWPIQSLALLYIPNIPPWAMTGIALPLALLMGLLSWRYVEKPALRYKASISKSTAWTHNR